jgi:glycosyltransferase involved in cell wall biosynthesis
MSNDSNYIACLPLNPFRVLAFEFILRIVMARIGIDARLTYYSQAGIAQYIQHLLCEIPALDVENDYLILQSRKDRRNLAQGVHQRSVACWAPAHHRLERLALAVEILPHRLDLLHSPDFIPPLGRWYSSVITIHDLTFLHYPDFLTAESRRYYNEQIEVATRHAHHILADSESTRTDILNLLNVPPEKVTTVLLAANARYKPVPIGMIEDVRARYNLPHDYLLFVGTFEPRKNIGGLLHAYSLLRNMLQDAPALVIAGKPGWLYEETLALIDSLGLSHHVVRAENIAFDDLPALYGGASVFCLPSFYEGFGLTALEAMACGTPIVVAERASLIEVAGRAGLLVDPESPEAIADALRRVLTDSALAADLRERGLAQAARFNWQETVRQTLAVYQRVLEET